MHIPLVTPLPSSSQDTVTFDSYKFQINCIFFTTISVYIFEVTRYRMSSFIFTILQINPHETLRDETCFHKSRIKFHRSSAFSTIFTRVSTNPCYFWHGLSNGPESVPFCTLTKVVTSRSIVTRGIRLPLISM